jgi:hypothetical protein
MDERRNANFATEKYNLDQERPVRYYLMDSEGKITSDMIDELKDTRNITAVVDGYHLFNIRALPFLQQPLISISDKGNIFTANSDEPLIKMYEDNGDYLKSFYFPTEMMSINRDEIIDIFSEEDEQNKNLLLHAELPEKWPALSSIVIDDENNLWISTISDNEDLLHEWLVLEDTGELIANFEWPHDEPIEVVKNGKMYTRQTDEETGLQRVVRYRIEIE